MLSTEGSTENEPSNALPSVLLILVTVQSLRYFQYAALKPLLHGGVTYGQDPLSRD